MNYSKLYKTIGASILILAVGMQQGEAKDKELDYLPVVDGWIVDQAPFDGIGDGIAEDDWVTVSLNSGIADIRGVLEFDVLALKHHRIKSAFLEIFSFGAGSLPGTEAIPIQLFGYYGDGSLQTDDFNEGRFITVFSGLTPNNVLISLDVTKFLQHIPKRFVGFSLRTNVHGAQVNFGSQETDTPPTLTVIYE